MHSSFFLNEAGGLQGFGSHPILQIRPRLPAALQDWLPVPELARFQEKSLAAEMIPGHQLRKCLPWDSGGGGRKDEQRRESALGNFVREISESLPPVDPLIP